jgi:uncharacterized membrane protein
MEQMLVAIFNTVPEALKAVIVLKELDRTGDITLHSTAVIAKDASGRVSLKQAAEPEFGGTKLGMFSGIILGALGGLVGLAIGGFIGRLGGLIFDLARTGISAGFLEQASNNLEPGKAALLAEIAEISAIAVDTKLAKLGGRVRRQSRSEFVDEQLMDELDTMNVG